MRLRRLELVFIGVTLAFAFFMGGFFTGRSWSSVNPVTVAAKGEDMSVTGSPYQPQETVISDQTGDNAAPGNPASDTSQIPSVNQRPDAQPDAAGEPRGGDGRININIASQSELTDLPGIGNVLASRIVDHRRQHGDFQRIEDIRNVSGIGEKRFEAIEDKITVGS